MHTRSVKLAALNWPCFRHQAPSLHRSPLPYSGVMSDRAITLFDRQLLRQRRDRAAEGVGGYDFLFAECADRLTERLEDVTRPFARVLDLGGRTGLLARAVAQRPGTETVISADLSPAMIRHAPAPAVVCDEEALPFADGSLDLIVSNLSLHWVNDLPGTLVQCRRALRPDGLFLATLFGGQTLHELRAALAGAEIDLDGGLSPRVSPFADVRDLGGLLTRAGFSLPVVDSDTLTVSYSHPLKLLADLRGMGESNAMIERRRTPLRRATLMEALRRYQDRHGDAEGRCPATFQVITLTAWAPDASQPQPKRPGSATSSLAEAVGGTFVPATPQGHSGDEV